MNGGQIGAISGNLVKGGTEEEFKQIMLNLNELLNATDLKLKDIIKVVIYLTDIKDYTLINILYSKSFSEPFPTRTVVQVSKLPLNANIEMEFISLKN